MTKQLLIALIFVWAIGCFLNERENQSIDYMIYGVYCGECYGHCATMYKLNENQLLIDTTDSFFKNSNKLERVVFKGDTLSGKHFQGAKVLKASIPKILLQSKDRTFGNPDSYDQCGIYV